MIALGFSDRVGLTLCDSSGKWPRSTRIPSSGRYACYPAGTGTLVIRTELDWGRDVNPVAVSSDGNTATFEIEAQQRFVHFKPCLIKNDSLHWAVGADNLLIMAAEDACPVYPYFFSDSRGRFSPIIKIESAILGRNHRLRIYLPPGYDLNTTVRYPSRIC